METGIIINTNIGVLNFEKPTKVYPGSLFDIIACPHCEHILSGQVVLNNKNKYKYIIKCDKCKFQEVG